MVGPINYYVFPVGGLLPCVLRNLSVQQEMIEIFKLFTCFSIDNNLVFSSSLSVTDLSRYKFIHKIINL